MSAAPRAGYFVLQQPLAAPPGTLFNYNSGSTELLGVILRKVSGKRLDEFAAENLFEPLGIEQPTWEMSPQGISAGGYGLRMPGA